MSAAPLTSPAARPTPPPVEVLKARQLVLSAEDLAISVVVAYEDPRARAEYVKTWTEGQTIAGDKYEVIVVTDGAHPAIEKEIAKHLRPQDVLVRSPGTERFLLCNVGAELARGDQLFFTEDHCLAEPGGVELAARVLGELKVECATVGWGNSNDSYVGLFEEHATTENMRVWHAPGHWNILRARGFVITRRAFVAAGRFPAGYGLFAEALFAARLHKGGVTVGYTPEEGVRHINSETLADLGGNAWNYSHHECLAATRYKPEFFHRYFDRSRVLLSHRIPPDEARSALSLVSRELARDWKARGGIEDKIRRTSRWVGLWLRTVASGHGGRASRVRAAAAVAWHWAACQIFRFNETRRYRAFGSFWQCAVRHARVEFLTRGAAHRRQLANGGGMHAGKNLELLHGWGLHPIETVEGQSLRWTSGLTVIPFRLPEGLHEVTLDSGGLRGKELAFPIEVYWDRHRVPKRNLRKDSGKLSFLASSPGGSRLQRLVILVPHLLDGGVDKRLMGLPLVGLTLTLCTEVEKEPPPSVQAAASRAGLETCTA